MHGTLLGLICLVPICLVCGIEPLSSGGRLGVVIAFFINLRHQITDFYRLLAFCDFKLDP
jgi:hypothetical protein